ncbi:imidazolonepropionase-like domain-containing protein [Streptomyces sp. LE64]|uniref:imidazolonepropionase-like domain-containing protein n=1 Tax=Streptomyces sp. LE64 TaxID=3448653 RepID=UPI0040427708
MLTLHTGRELVLAWHGPGPALPDGAVAVRGDRIAAVGPLEDLRERFPGARVRSWPGVLGPGRTHTGALPSAPSPRERVHAVLTTGATGVLAARVTDPALRSAAERAGVLVHAVAPEHAPGTAVLVEGGRADLTAFGDAPGGGAECLVTVCAGRIVHRRR